MSNYVVTGCAGFIGSHLCENLIQRGHNIIGIDDLNSYVYSESLKVRNIESIRQQASRVNGNFKFVIADVRDPLSYDFIFEKKIDGVFHLAALTNIRMSKDDPSSYFDVNCRGTAVLLDLMSKNNVKSMVFSSSSSVYGEWTSGDLIESQESDFQISPYASSKKSAELLCRTYSHLYDMGISVMRIFSSYGPRMRPDLVMHNFAEKIFNGKTILIYGDGGSARDYTHVMDVCSGLVKGMEYATRQKTFDIFNLGESRALSLRELIFLLEENFELSAKKEHVATVPGEILVSKANIEKSKLILGYEPLISKSKGIKEFVKWFLSTNECHTFDKLSIESKIVHASLNERP